MKRLMTPPRINWQAKVESQGMYFHTIDGETYWDETAYYEFSLSEIETIEKATNDLHDICLEAVQYVIDKKLYSKLMIPSFAEALIENSWNNDELHIYGRFDLAYDGRNPPKLLEYNADTPTSLLEASVIQWFWLKDKFPEADQFNSIHEKLIETWKTLNISETLYFSCAKDSEEDLGNLEYLRDTAMQAGLSTEHIFIEDIGYSEGLSKFIDQNSTIIKNLFKLYPWEWMTSEYFGRFIALSGILVKEPPWKMILSNKGILPILWEMYPNHENLLKASFDDRDFKDNFVSKPLLSREGANITLVKDGKKTEYDGEYGGSGVIFQELATLAQFGPYYPVIGSWIIGGIASGIGIREDVSLVTTNNSHFVPHLFR